MSVTTAVLASPLLAQPPATPPAGGGCGGGASGLACSLGNAVGGAVGSVAGAAAGSAFDSIVGELSQGVGKAVGLMMSFWMHIPIPSIGDGSAADRLHQATVYLTVITAVISLFFAAGKFALASRSASVEAGEEAVKGLVRVVVASVVIVPAAILASQAADSYSTWLVGQAANGDVPAAIEKLSGVPQALGIGFTFIMAILALVASIVQAFLILIRDALLILLVGALPLAAAASITGAGRQTWTKLIGWLIAFIVFKPVAAMVYATALWSVTDTSSPFNQVAGLFLVILAVFTLPALMRLIVPQVQQVGSGGGVALAGAAAGVATGAKETSGKGSSSGGSGGGGQAGGGKQGKAQFLGEQGSSPSGSKGGGTGGSAPGGGSPGGGGSPSGPGGGSPGGAPGGAPGGPGGGGTGGGGAAGGQAAGAAAGVGVAAAQKVYQGAKSTGAVTSGAGAGAADGT